MNLRKIVSWVLLVVLAFGLSLDADAQEKKKKKKKKKKGNTTEVVIPPSRIINSDRSTECEVFTGGVEKTDEDLARISQTFADMNLRRQVGDYGPGDYSAHYYWTQMYEEAPGFSILVYTDGSAIFREMAAQAKEEGDEDKFKEYADRALSLLEEGEKCYPGGDFSKAEAYIYELLYPTEYQKIFDLYTQGFGEDTDPYSLMSITRYGLYMGYIGEISREEGIKWYEQAKAFAAAKPGDRDYEYALEVVDLTWEDQYKELYAELEAAENAPEEEEEPTDTTDTASSDGNPGLYNEMIDAFNSNNYSVAYTKFNEYITTVQDAQRGYDVSIYAAQNFESAEDYPKAKNAYLKAYNFDQSQGFPYYRIGMMYLSSGPICGPGTGFDSQRVLWPAFEKLKIAQTKTLDASESADISSTISEYKAFLPFQWQLDENGLKNGDAYTVPCWINETITIVSNETYN